VSIQKPELEENVRKEYKQIKQQGKEEELYGFLEEEYRNEKEVHFELLNVLQGITRESEAYIRCAKVRLEIELERENDPYLELELVAQIYKK
jgi:hypothetical protein